MKQYLVALVGLVSVAGCGGGSAAPAAAPQPRPSASVGQQRPGPPGTSGRLAALSGSTLQVQISTAQTAVTYSRATTFTDTVRSTYADVRVGSCVTVRGRSSAPTLTAVSVSVIDPMNGSCAGGFGRGIRPSGGPDGRMRSGSPNGRSSSPGNAGFAFGRVVARSANGFAVQSGRLAALSSGPQTVKVTVTASTTFTASKPATATALQVGECVTARGTADSTGTVAATAISIRPALGGSCSTGPAPGA